MRIPGMKFYFYKKYISFFVVFGLIKGRIPALAKSITGADPKIFFTTFVKNIVFLLHLFLSKNDTEKFPS